MDAAAQEGHSQESRLSLSTEEDIDDGDYDFDLAIKHERNITLRNRPMVIQFFAELGKLESLMDPATRDWLGEMPVKMQDEVIPLFEDNDRSMEYQLHPSYTRLALGQPALHPHPEIFSLYSVGSPVFDFYQRDPVLVMGIGRIFVNVESGENNRLSKWTGYEVFVDQKLALWMVFDRRSINHSSGDWYEFHSALSEVGDKSSKKGIPMFDCAIFCGSIRDVKEASLEKALDAIKKRHIIGNTMAAQVEREEIDKMSSYYQNLRNY